MKIICKKKKLLFALITVFIILLNSFLSYANVNHLMIRTDSNALMTLDLNDDDYSIMPLSSIGTVTNTVNWPRYNAIAFPVKNGSGHLINVYPPYEISNGVDFAYSAPDGYTIQHLDIMLNDCLPPPGTYNMSIDFGSDFSIEYSRMQIRSQKNTENASSVVKWADINFQQSSGDIYVPPFSINLTNVQGFLIRINFDEPVYDIGGLLHVNFTPIEDSSPDITTAGTNTSTQDYQSDVSSSLSDLSSSVDEVSDEIGFVAEAIQNLQGAMEPHYNNVLTQLHHITEQLHAFYDQIYNNIHLKEYALWQDIKTAIENIDLEVNVNLDKLKTSIDNMSQAVQNKLQSVTDTITGGYNNSGMQEDNNELSGALDELDNAEQEVLNDVNGYIEGFEYPSFDGISSGIIGALSFFGGLLHSIFLGMGEFGLIITFSLTMIFVLIIVGYHRIRS